MSVSFSGNGVATGVTTVTVTSNISFNNINTSTLAATTLNSNTVSVSGNMFANAGYSSAASAYGCRAWVNFNSTTATITIRGSGNISSITDNGTGDYTLNFTNAMSDANYSMIGLCADNDDNAVGPVSVGFKSTTYTPSASARRFETVYNGTSLDSPYVYVAIFR